MGMYRAASDRDWAEECHGSGGPGVITTPCAICRKGVRVSARSYSYYTPSYCSEGCRWEAEARETARRALDQVNEVRR